MGTERVGFTWKLVEEIMGSLCDILIMIERGVVVVFLPCTRGPHEAAREASGVVGSFLEWRCC